MKKVDVINNQKGSIAILMVITAVIIISPIMINFTYDGTINKLKVYNIEDRYKARLTAESGVKFAMARLLLYKEAYNFLESNKEAKETVKQKSLDSIWNFPFMYPIPVLPTMNAIQKEAIKDFQEETILNGSLQLTIINISNKINLNLLRISLIAQSISESKEKAKKEDEGKSEGDFKFSPENQLLQILDNAIESESENNEEFSAKYFGIETQLLVNELKFYVSDPNSLEDAGGGESKFDTEDITAKHAPLMSFSEIYTLPSWPDQIINLIANEFTIHGAIMIDLNKITDKLLKILIPDISEEDIKEFFKYKNDPEDPKYFNNLDDFKNYIVNIGNIMNQSDFEERFKKFEKEGLQFGPTPTLFKISSRATVGRSKYNLSAFVTIPAKPDPRPLSSDKEDEDEDKKPVKPTPDEAAKKDDAQDDPPKDDDEDKKEEDKKTLLLNPRIVEILID